MKLLDIWAFSGIWGASKLCKMIIKSFSHMSWVRNFAGIQQGSVLGLFILLLFVSCQRAGAKVYDSNSNMILQFQHSAHRVSKDIVLNISGTNSSSISSISSKLSFIAD